MTNFKKGEKISKEFSNLKGRILAHEESSSHKSNHAKQMESKYEDFVPATAEERRASMCCARSAYHAIRSQQSQESYEEAIANKAADGINVGDLNHSVAFARNFTASLYKEITNKLRETMNEPLAATGIPPPHICRI